MNGHMTGYRRQGFTIVELLIVIVIIGILAAIVIVAFNGVQERARMARINTSLTQYSKKIESYRVQNDDSYPPTIEAVGVKDEDGMDYQYVTTGSSNYCLMVTARTQSYFVSHTSSTMQAGTCGGYNMTAWNKTNGSPPISGIVVDTSTFRTSTASMRLGPGATGRTIAGSPYTGTTGQTYTVSLWIKTDSDWNGLSNNSKIRFGDSNGGTLLRACGYNGVKTSWTQVTCSYTFTSGVSGATITVGNDGTTGNIWIDDLSVTKS